MIVSIDCNSDDMIYSEMTPFFQYLVRFCFDKYWILTSLNVKQYELD